MTLWLVYGTLRKSNTCTRWWGSGTSGALNGLSKKFATRSTQIKCTTYRTLPLEAHNKVDNIRNFATGSTHIKCATCRTLPLEDYNKVDNTQNFATRSSQ
jgi:hypothetical protein